MSVRRKRNVRNENLTSEEAHEAAVLCGAIKAAIKRADLATLRTLLRVIRYAEEGKTPVAVPREGLQDNLSRKINLGAYLDKNDPKE